MKTLYKIALIFLICLLSGCVTMVVNNRRVKNAKITMYEKNGKVVFNIDYVAAGIIFIQIVDEKTGEILWQVKPKYHKKNEITYGDMDQFTNKLTKQAIPVGRSAPDILGKLVRVRIGIQYDEFMAPSVKDVETTFQINLNVNS